MAPEAPVRMNQTVFGPAIMAEEVRQESLAIGERKGFGLFPGRRTGWRDTRGRCTRLA